MTDQPIYQGQFGDFTIDEEDRRGVILYRTGLAITSLSLILGVAIVLRLPPSPMMLHSLTALYFLFSAGLGLSLWMIHIYLVVLHRALQGFWVIGTVSALVFTLTCPEPLALCVYHQPLTLLGLGFSFAALTGIFFKEAFCFNRLETKFLTPLIPIILLGHMLGWLTPNAEQILIALMAGLLMVFIVRKAIQAIPPDIGDKSVFIYLKQQRSPA